MKNRKVECCKTGRLRYSTEGMSGYMRNNEINVFREKHWQAAFREMKVVSLNSCYMLFLLSMFESQITDQCNENLLWWWFLYANLLSLQHDNGIHMDGFPMFYLFCGQDMYLCSLGKMTHLEHHESCFCMRR